MKKINVRIGSRFNRLKVVKEIKKESHYRFFECICDCGKTVIARLCNLRSGHSKSCGCYGYEKVFKHGYSGKQNPEYDTWINMKSRCSYKPGPEFHRYGGRGIFVCKRWEKSFENFLSDMGKKPSKRYSLERIDPNGPYSKANCKWATRIEQNNNTSRNVFLTINGVKKTISDWSRIKKVHHSVVRSRIKYGWPLKDLFIRPLW